MYTAAGRTSGTVAGVAIWLPAERAVMLMATQIRLGMWAAPSRLGFWSSKRVLNYPNYLDRLRKKYAKQNFLWMLGVKPTYQGKDGGTALLEKGLNSHRGYCYLETHRCGETQVANSSRIDFITQSLQRRFRPRSADETKTVLEWEKPV
ncbi:MAG TPA: hypothetical protein VLK23_14925 [Thermodesulfobacteriota bacterium]|nr:hypothetical protein [Thermodesulfobacteriota bacterium]